MLGLVLPLFVVAISLSWWLAVYYSPGVLSRLLPRDLTFFIGLIAFVFGAFSACYAVYQLRDPRLFLGALVQCFSATWFMLAPSAGSRGEPEDASMLRSLAAMLGAGAGVLLLSLYVRGPLVMGALQLWLILFGATVALRPRVWRDHS